MKRIGKMILTGMAILLSTGLSAQTKTFSLKECVETGIRNNLDVLRSGLDAEASKANLKQAKASLFPDLNGNATHGVNQGRSIDPFTNSFINQNVSFASYNLSSSLTLFNGLRLINTVKQNALGLKAAEMDFQQQQDNLTIQIILAYLQVLSSQDQLVQARNQAVLSSRQVERLDALNRQGAIAPYLLTDLKGDLANNELNILSVENAVQTALVNLCQLMNIPYSRDMQLEPLNPDMFQMEYAATPEQIYQKALSQFAQVKAADLRSESAAKGVKVARGWLYPELSLNGNVNTNYSSAAFQNLYLNTTEVSTNNYVLVNGAKSPLIVQQDNFATEKLKYKKQLDNNLFTSLNLNLRIPIFNGLQARTRVRLAELDQKLSKYQANTTRVQLQQAIEQAYINMTTALNRYKTLTSQVESYTASFQAAEARFNEGVGTSVDYLTAKNNLDRSRINLIMARYDFALRTKLLDFYQGLKVVY